MKHITRLRLPCAALIASLLTTSTLVAADKTAHPIVPGFERFYTGEKADAARGGQLLLAELNCISCHQPADRSLAHKQAPILDHVGERVRAGHLRKFLSDPQAVKPGTTMPNQLAADPKREEKIDALVHFLASTGSLRYETPDGKAAAVGRELYKSVGCVACHGTRDAAGNPEKVAAASVPLGDLKTKYSISSLTAFLNNPHDVRPSGRMPKLLAAKEPREVANYLLQGAKFVRPNGQGATAYRYYEGTWTKLPDFDKLKPVATGTSAAFSLGVARRGDYYGIRFEGFFKINQEATYTFGLLSDDGSRLFVDGKLVVDNDGSHPPQEKKGAVKLTKGVHKVSIDFFQGGGGAALSVKIEAPVLPAANFAELVAPTAEALNPKANPADDDYLADQPELVEKGKALFVSTGCANCHQLTSGAAPLTSTLAAEPLAKLKGAGGCLSATPAQGVPAFRLSTAQRTALAAALKTPPAPAKTPAEIITQTMTTFNCYACHVRDKVGGPQEELNKFFLTAQPEMGDEGRLPPPLTGVGAKINPDYLKMLLDKGVHDRPYMFTRMPGFGDANVGQLVAAFGVSDDIAKAPEVKFELALPRVKATARHLVSGQAFGCIKCHTFNGVKAEGVQGIDMTLMPRRLRRDWFHAYVEDPQRLRPGTRMPGSFVKGKSVLPEILDGKPATQIEAIWQYISDGPKALLPVGMGPHTIVLVPTDGAILYRNFIEGSGPRAIAVGYPEMTHLSFDANEVRLSMLWQGAFIDAAKHWTDRGVGYQKPLGDNIIHLHGGAAFAELAKPDQAWPTAAPKSLGYRFLGYRLTDDDRPTFMYSFGDVKVDDFPNALNGKKLGIHRTLNLTASKPVDNLYFRAAVGSKIEALADGWYRIDGTWNVHFEGAAPIVRQSAGKTELLVPVRFVDGKAKLVEEFVW